MDVRPGYKQTEAGVLPEDWQIAHLGNLVKITSGASPSLFRFVGTGIPYYKVEQLSSAEKYLDAESTPYLFERGDTVPERSVVFAKRGAAIALNKVRILKQPSFMDTNLMALTPQDVLECEYLFYALGHIGLWKFADTTSVPQINNKHVNPLPFALPRPPEQLAIATALSDVDALLDGMDRLIAKKRDIKQAAMQQLLTGQTRLPGFQGEWTVTTLGSVVESIVGGGTPTRSVQAYWGNEIPWVTVKDFATFNPRSSQEGITRLGLSNSPSNLIPAGTLITSTRMALGKAVVYEVDVAINQDLKALFLDRETSVKFVSYWFEHFGKVIDGIGSGSTVKGISVAELKNLRFSAPKLPEQTAIAAVLSDMDAEIAALEARRDKTGALKQGMMQELLTGRTRLV